MRSLALPELSVARTVAHVLAVILIISSCAQAIPLEDFYSFGSGTTDAQLPPNDDEFAGPIDLPAPALPFYDEPYETIFVSS